jgi:hypothetical protein
MIGAEGLNAEPPKRLGTMSASAATSTPFAERRGGRRKSESIRPLTEPRLATMLSFKPTVFISHSERFKEAVAIPFRDHVESLGMTAILVSEMPTPEGGAGEPDSKVDYYLDRSEMFVALMTPDDRTESGEVHARPNVTDEISRARSKSHLRERVQVFKATEVDLHSNINPTYEALDPTDVAACFAIFERQAVAWEILDPSPAPAAPSAPAIGPIGPIEGTDSPPPAEARGARAQAALAVEELRRSLLNPAAEPAATPTPFPPARAHLAASVALAAVRSISTFGVHELNGLYREREALELRPEEKRHLLRSIVLHTDDENAPGWYWFRDRLAGELYGLLVELAREDPDLSVRTRSLDLLARTTETVPAAELRLAIATGLAEGGAVRAAALRLLATRGDTRLLGRLGDEVGTADASEAVLAVRASHAPGAALRELERRPLSHSRQAEERLLDAARRLPLAPLRRGLRGGDSRVRLLCLRALARSSRLRRADVIDLVALGGARERQEALRVGLARGWSFDPEVLEEAVKDPGIDFETVRELRVAFHGRRPAQELLAELEWVGEAGTGSTIYGALAEYHPDAVSERIRVDLDEDFASLRDAYRSYIEAAILAATEGKLAELPVDRQPESEQVAAMVTERVEAFFAEHPSLEDFTLRTFQAAALRGLLAHGEAGDVRFARRFLVSEDRELEAISVGLLARFGEAADEEGLIAIATEANGERAGRAAAAALALSGDLPATVDRLIAIGNPRLTRVAIAALVGSSMDDAVPRLMPLLDDESDAVRRQAAEALAARLPTKKGRRALLGHYLSTRSYYYYNVVVALDRILWAPGWLRTAVRSQD